MKKTSVFSSAVKLLAILLLALSTNAFAAMLTPGTTLLPGKSVSSDNGRFFLIMQTDGNLVLYRKSDGLALWNSKTTGKKGAYAVMQGDGNFVIYLNGTALWHTVTGGNPNAYLLVQNDGNVVVYKAGTYIPLWNAGTGSPTISSVVTAQYIPDANFRTCILNAANAVTPKLEFVREIAQLNCAGKGISTIKGVSVLSSLSFLTIGWNNLNDVTPVIGMSTLKTLHLASKIPETNQLFSSNIAAIKGMSTIETLSVYSPKGSQRLTQSAFDGGFTGLKTLMFYTQEMGGTPASPTGFPCSFIVYLSNRMNAGMTLYVNNVKISTTSANGMPACIAGI